MFQLVPTNLILNESHINASDKLSERIDFSKNPEKMIFKKFENYSLQNKFYFEIRLSISFLFYNKLKSNNPNHYRF